MILFKKSATKNAAFTLVEIVVVIGIMALLTSLIYSSFDKSKAKSRDQQRVSDISAIQLALELYFNKNGVYPKNLDNKDIIPFVPTYMNSVPVPPSGEPYHYLPLTRSGNYCVSYQLWTKFEAQNSYLDAKKGFDSYSKLSSSGYSECGGDNTHVGAKVDSSTDSLVYDVMP